MLRLSGVATTGAVLAACAPAPAGPAQVVKETVVVEVEKEVAVKETVVVEKEVAAGPTSIRFSVWYGQGDIEVWDQVIDAFEKANPDVKVDFEPLAWTQYWQKLQVGLASGDTPDAIGMGVGVSYDYAGRGQLFALDPYIERDQVDKAQWFQGLLEEAIWPKPGGELFALPYRFTGSAFFINKTLFDNAGIAYPEKGWTWPNEYLKLAQDLTDADAGQWGSLVPPNQLVQPFLGTNETSALTPDLRKSNWLDPKVKEVVQFLTDLTCTHKVAPSPEVSQGLGDLFLSGKVAMVPGAQWDIAAYRKITDFEWDVVYNPMKEGVNKMSTYGGPDMLSIPKPSKQPDAAWKFILFSTGSPEAQTLMSATAVPTLIAQASDPAFVEAQAQLGPASYAIIVEQGNDAVGYSFSPAWNEWSGGFSWPILQQIYNCKLSVDEGLVQIDEGVQKILDEAYEALGV
jgi:multiple sugar transport system substrate-binding protein